MVIQAQAPSTRPARSLAAGALLLVALLLPAGGGLRAQAQPDIRMKLYIIHGYGAGPQHHWFPWLAEQARKQGAEATVLSLPDPSAPRPEAWQQALREAVPAPDCNTLFVAHSLGCISLLRYLDSLPGERKIGGLILVSGFSGPLPILPALDAFTATPIDYARIRQMTPHRIVIGAADDAIVPYALTEALGKSLEAKSVKLEKGGHFLADDGFTEFPRVLDELRAIAP